MSPVQLIAIVQNLVDRSGLDHNNFASKQDIAITICVAMDSAQRMDLASMIEFLEQKRTPIDTILFNVLHDLNGLKAIHLGQPHGDCFIPRCAGYALKMQQILSARKFEIKKVKDKTHASISRN